MIDQQDVNRARGRFKRFHDIIFASPLTMIHEVMYDCIPDLPATWEEKTRLAKAMSLADLEKELTHTKQTWFTRKKIKQLLREKQALLQI